MKRIVIVALSMLALGASVVQAEARDEGRAGDGHHTTAPDAGASSPGLAVIPGLTLRSDAASADASAAKPAGVMTAEALTPGESGSLKIPTAGHAPAAPAAGKKPDEPWCRSGRIAGSGTGFCLIN